MSLLMYLYIVTINQQKLYKCILAYKLKYLYNKYVNYDISNLDYVICIL